MIMVSHVRTRQEMAREESSTIAQDYAKWSDLIDEKAIGVLSVLHAALWRENGITKFPVPVDALEELRRLKFLTYETDGPGRVTVTLNKR